MSVENWIQRMDRFLSQFGPEEFPTAWKNVFSASLLFLCLYSIVRGVAAAASRPFWFDELLTLTISSQPTLHDMWTAITRGFDGQPPPFYLLERICLALPISKEISLRLPSILSFPLLLACVFTFAKKCSGQLIACLCALAMLSTSLFHLYLIEARGYMLMNACIAFALVCYQRLPSRRWAAMLAVSLFLAQSFHYYALFAVIPFGLAEAAYFTTGLRFRWQVWSALVFGVLPLLFYRPLLNTLKTYHGSHHFSRPVKSFWVWTQYYGSYFFVSGVLGVALVAVSAAAIVWSHLQRDRTCSQGKEAASSDSAIAECVLLLSLLALPPILIASMRLIQGASLDRYTLPATIGVILGLARLLRILKWRAAAFFGLFLVCSLGLGEARFWRVHRYDPMAQQSWYDVSSSVQFREIEKFVQSGGHEHLPVVFGHAHVYCQMVYYSPQSLTRRLVYLVDPNRELQFTNADSTFRDLKGLREFFLLNLADYSEFIATHSEFLLYADRPEWQLQSLTADATSVQILEMNGDKILYLVKMKKSVPD